MRTVAAAIREDLGKVEDVSICSYVAGASPPSSNRRSEILRKIADTLGVLGLGELRQLVVEETNGLEAMAAGKSSSITRRWSALPPR